MQRKMIGFFQDEEGDWTSRLDCGHTQHVRHTPPFIERPWVMTPEGRASKLGEFLECPECDEPDSFKRACR